MRIHLIVITVIGLVCLIGCAPARTRPSSVAVVRAELERRYAENVAAFERQDVPAIMALRAPGFHAIMPDGHVRDRAEMETYTVGLLNGIRKWNETTFTID